MQTGVRLGNSFVQPVLQSYAHLNLRHIAGLIKVTYVPLLLRHIVGLIKVTYVPLLLRHIAGLIKVTYVPLLLRHIVGLIEVTYVGCLLWPGASQWIIYYHRMWRQLSTTCSNLLK